MGGHLRRHRLVEFALKTLHSCLCEGGHDGLGRTQLLVAKFYSHQLNVFHAQLHLQLSGCGYTTGMALNFQLADFLDDMQITI
jgi:hypothetical protein